METNTLSTTPSHPSQSLKGENQVEVVEVGRMVVGEGIWRVLQNCRAGPKLNSQQYDVCGIDSGLM